MKNALTEKTYLSTHRLQALGFNVFVQLKPPAALVDSRRIRGQSSWKSRDHCNTIELDTEVIEVRFLQTKG